MHRDTRAIHWARHRNWRREKPHQGNHKPLKGTMWEEQNHSVLMKGKVRQHRETSCSFGDCCCKTGGEYSQPTGPTDPSISSPISAAQLIEPTPVPISGVTLPIEQTSFSIGELQGWEMPNVWLRKGFSSWFYTQLFRSQHYVGCSSWACDSWLQCL